MKIRSITITNFRGISDATTISFNDFCCIIGKMMQANGKDEFVEIINSINNIINGTNI